MRGKSRAETIGRRPDRLTSAVPVGKLRAFYTDATLTRWAV